MTTPSESQAGFVRVPLADGGEVTLLSRLTDGRIMCCICFEYRTREELDPVADEPGKVWDVCRACAIMEGK